MEVPNQLLEQTRQAIAAEQGWRANLRALPTGVRTLLAMAIVGATVGVIGLGMRRADWAAYPTGLMTVSTLLLAGGAVAALAAFLRPIHRRAPRAVWLGAVAVAGFGIPALLALLPEAHALVELHPESFAGAGADLVPRALACFLFGAATALPALGLLLLLDRADRRTPARMLMVAALAGLTANLVLLMHCPLVTRSHLLLGHATVPLLFGLIALTAVQKLEHAQSENP